MTVTVRGDGILYSDGTLQTTASRGAGSATTTSWGTGYSAGNLLGSYDGMITTFSLSNGIANGQLGPGKGQTWRNMTGARAGGVTYYNTTKRGIVVTITTGKTGNWSNAHIFVNGALACTSGGDQSAGFGGSNVNAFAIVPPGASYSAEGSTGISHWAELS